MDPRETSTAEVTDATEALRSALKSQYRAALAMLKEAIERCPQDAWADARYVNACWQVAYHTLFFAHFYLQRNQAAFRPWADHQGDVQYPDAIAGPADPDSRLPLIPDPYTKDQVLEYWSFIDRRVDDAIDDLDLHSPESGFSSYQVPKLEHQLVNIRHIQHGAAQLADRLRSAADLGVRWVGFRRSDYTSAEAEERRQHD